MASASHASRSAREVGAVAQPTSNPPTMVNSTAMTGVAFMAYPPSDSLLLAHLLSAHGAAADQVHDRQQDNGAKQ